MNNRKVERINSKADLLEIIGESIDEELEEDILDFNFEENGIKEKSFYEYYQKTSIKDILYLFEEYQAKWNPSSKIYDIINAQLEFYCDIEEEKYFVVNFPDKAKEWDWNKNEKSPY